MIVNDSSRATEYLDMTVDLVQVIADQYNIDKNRIYTTGQSMGCMSSIAMDIKYPDLFAASLLVAGQWDPTLVSPMARQNLWIVVSEGDTKARPGMDNITAVLEQNGGTVSRGTWNAEASPEELASDVNRMVAEDTNIKYTVFEGGSHRYTWQKAYGIEGLRDWLFTQVKT